MQSATLIHPRPRPNRAIIAGFCASAASALVFLFAHIIAKIFAQGGLGGATAGALVDNNLTALASSNLYMAVGLHFVMGIGLGWVYMKLRHYLPENSWTAVTLFLLGPFLLSIFVLFPLSGGGLFGLGYGAGLLPGIGSFVLHAVYGITLVGLYEKIDLMSSDMQQSDGLHSSSPRPNLQHAVIGILGGSAIGMTVAAAFWFLGRDSFAVPGLPVEFTFMALVFFFSSMGLLIGFWTGVPARSNVALES